MSSKIFNDNEYGLKSRHVSVVSVLYVSRGTDSEIVIRFTGLFTGLTSKTVNELTLIPVNLGPQLSATAKHTYNLLEVKYHIVMYHIIILFY